MGRSLGVDLTPFKTCTLDCVFCQLGRTTDRTIERKPYVPAAEVENELEAWAKSDGKAGCVTLAGSGEPTLNFEFGEVLKAVHRHTRLPAALLSNGTLFDRSEVRAAAKEADIVKLSLSAWDADSFARVHRPHPGVDFSRVLQGYRTFRTEYSGRLWIEVFLVPGFNTERDNVERMAALVAQIVPDAVHLNTAVRPPAEADVQPLSREAMVACAGLFRPRALVTAEYATASEPDWAADEEGVFALLARRPCTARQIADVSGMHVNAVSKILGRGVRMGTLSAREREGAVYYSVTNPRGIGR